MKTALIGMGLLALAGCTPAATQATVNNDVLAAEVGLTAAEKAATLYTTLPRCTVGVTFICSDATAVANIKAADNKAYAAVKLAEANSGMISAAVTAVADLTSLIPVTSGGAAK